jgi:hypothetical protein
MKKADSTQPLSPMHYAMIAVAGLIIAAGFTLFYIYQVPKLVANGAQGQIFYLLLIPWALSCAAFLFGAMKSYATFTYKHLGGVLELGGPVVLFCLVLVGGFKLVPPSAESFDVTVRAHSADQHDPMITLGKITLDLDNDRRTAPLGVNGEADFKGIPAKFKGSTLRVLPQVEGYEEQWQEQQLKGNVLDLALARAAPAVTILKGIISPPPAAGKTVRVFVDGQKGETSADDLGRFELSVNGKPGDRVVVKVYVDGKQVYDDFQVLPGPVTLSLHKPDTARGEAPHGSSSATQVQSPITQGPRSALSINQQGALQRGRLILTRIRT